MYFLIAKFAIFYLPNTLLAQKNLKKLSDQIGRKDFVDRNNPHINVKRQAELLNINRTSVYRQLPEQKSISAEDLFVMRGSMKFARLTPPGVIEPSPGF